MGDGVGLVPAQGRAPLRQPGPAKAVDPARAERNAKRARSALLIIVAILCAFDVGRFSEWVPGLGSLPFAKLLLPLGAAALFTRRDVRRRLRVLSTPQGKAFGCFLAVIILSIPTSLWPGGSFGALSDYFRTAVPPLILIAATGESLEELSWVMRAYVFAMCCIGVALKAGFAQVDSDGRVSLSTTYDANDLALIAVVGFPMAASLIREKTLGLRLFGVFGVAMALLIVVVSTSRGGLIGMGVVIAFGLVIYRNSLPGWAKFALIPALIVGGALAPASFWERMSSLGHLNDDYNTSSETGRMAIWTRGMGYYAEHPITGVGFEAYPVAEGDWAAKYRTGGDTGFKFSVSHNSVVQVLAELGTLGFISWLAMFAPTFGAGAKARKLVRRKRAPPALSTTGDTLILSIIGFFVSGFFLSAAYGIAATTLVAFGMAYWGIVKRAAAV
jgi:putative inorganic carbon (hco3(-)) transporter